MKLIILINCVAVSFLVHRQGVLGKPTALEDLKEFLSVSQKKTKELRSQDTEKSQNFIEEKTLAAKNKDIEELLSLLRTLEEYEEKRIVTQPPPTPPPILPTTPKMTYREESVDEDDLIHKELLSLLRTLEDKEDKRIVTHPPPTLPPILPTTPEMTYREESVDKVALEDNLIDSKFKGNHERIVKDLEEAISLLTRRNEDRAVVKKEHMHKEVEFKPYSRNNLKTDVQDMRSKKQGNNLKTDVQDMRSKKQELSKLLVLLEKHEEERVAGGMHASTLPPTLHGLPTTPGIVMKEQEDIEEVDNGAIDEEFNRVKSEKLEQIHKKEVAESIQSVVESLNNLSKQLKNL